MEKSVRMCRKIVCAEVLGALQKMYSNDTEESGRMCQHRGCACAGFFYVFVESESAISMNKRNTEYQ